jgi:hypothetical protein
MSEPIDPREAASVSALRREFDAAFALPPAPVRATTRFLLASVDGTSLAVPIGECVAVRRVDDLARLPSAHRAFTGVVGLSGAVLPAYDVGPLVGLSRASGHREWLVVARTPNRVCFLFDRIEGYADVAGAGSAHGTYAEIGGARRRLVSLAAVVRELEAEAGTGGLTTE